MVYLEGKVADRFRLNAGEDYSLGDLIDPATHSFRKISTINPALWNWTDDQAQEYFESSKADLRRDLLALATEVPLESQVGDLQDAISHLVSEYVALDLDRKYDVIDKSLFELERSIEYYHQERYSGDKWVNLIVPVFAHAKFGDSEWMTQQVKDNEYRTTTYEIKSTAPPITREAKEKAKAFIGDYMTAISEALNDETVGSFLLRELSEGTVHSPELSMYWIPKPEELGIEVEEIDKDPLLIGTVFRKHYLIHNWDVEGEQPYEHYLREFKV